MTFARAIWFMIKVGLLASAAVWLANRPGNLSLVWFGYRIDLPPLGLAMLGVLAGLVALALVGRVVARIVAVPGEIGAMRGHAREARGYRMLTRGLAAAAGGDIREARRLSASARKLLGAGGTEPPITRLLAAQAAQLEGDEAAALQHFRILAETPETAILGLRGLALAALKAGDEEEARRLSERALAASPNAPWAAETALRLQAKSGRFDAAEESLRALVRAGAMTAPEGQRRRAALLAEKARQALAVGGGDIGAGAAVAAAREAVKLAGDFAPARFILARLLARQGKRKEAMRLIEQDWDSNPHEILGEAFLAAGENERPIDRTQRLERLQRQNPDHPETHRVVAAADLAAELWGEARRHLDRLAALEGVAQGGPVRGTCLAYARLEAGEFGDDARQRKWLEAAATARPDAGWFCRQCGQPGEAGPESGGWQLICTGCGALDSLDWRHPQAGRTAGAGGWVAIASATGSEGAGHGDGVGPAARPGTIEVIPPGPGSRTDTSGPAPSPGASVDAARLIN